MNRLRLEALTIYTGLHCCLGTCRAPSTDARPSPHIAWGFCASRQERFSNLSVLAADPLYRPRGDRIYLAPRRRLWRKMGQVSPRRTICCVNRKNALITLLPRRRDLPLLFERSGRPVGGRNLMVTPRTPVVPGHGAHLKLAFLDLQASLPCIEEKSEKTF